MVTSLGLNSLGSESEVFLSPSVLAQTQLMSACHSAGRGQLPGKGRTASRQAHCPEKLDTAATLPTCLHGPPVHPGRPGLGPLEALSLCLFFLPSNPEADMVAEIGLEELNGLEMEVMRRQASVQDRSACRQQGGTRKSSHI